MKSTKVVYLNNWYWIDNATIDSGIIPAYSTWDLKEHAYVNGKRLIFYTLPDEDIIEYVSLPKRSRN